MIKKTITSILLMFIIGCTTTKEQMQTTEKKEEEKVIKKEDSKVKSYGKNKEIQAVTINGKDYYAIGGKNIEKLSEDEIKKMSIVAPLKVQEDTIKGIRGIIITYYDVKIFLGSSSGNGTKVGLFEPQYNAWTVGNDSDDSQDIEVSLSQKSKAIISIRRSSISLSYR